MFSVIAVTSHPGADDATVLDDEIVHRGVRPDGRFTALIDQLFSI